MRLFPGVSCKLATYNQGASCKYELVEESAEVCILSEESAGFINYS